MTTEAEFAEYLADQFEIADKSLNGALSQVEFSVWSEEVMGTRIPVAPGWLALDKNQDGHVSEAEFLAAFLMVFDRFDKDKNRAISHSELLSTYGTAIPGARKGSPSGEGGRGGGRGGGKGGGGRRGLDP